MGSDMMGIGAAMDSHELHKARAAGCEIARVLQADKALRKTLRGLVSEETWLWLEKRRKQNEDDERALQERKDYEERRARGLKKLTQAEREALGLWRA